MALTNVEICSNALIRLGANPIQSFTEGTDIATSCGSIYSIKSDYMLGSYPWRFTMKFAPLSKLLAEPTAQWSYKFTLPADRLTGGLPAVFTSDSVGASAVKNYTIMYDTLMSNYPELWIQYQAKIDESLWEAYFTELMISVMMVELSFLVTENASLRQELMSLTYGIPSELGVGGIYGKAMALDSRDNPTIQIQDFSLTQARFGAVG